MAKGIYKRGSTYWIRYADRDGRIQFKSTTSKRFKDAETLLLSKKNAAKLEQKPELKKIENHSFKELCEKYMLWVNGRQKAANIKCYIIGQLLETFGNLPLRRFSTSLAEQLQTDIINKGRKPATNNKTLNILKHMFSKATEWEMVESDVLKRIRKVKLLPDTGSRLRYLSVEECQALVNACDNHLKPIVVTALNSGMRRGEILSLEWDNHIDLKHRFILLEITKNGERREIPINNTLKSTLQSLTRRIDIPYVFFDNVTGKRYLNVKTSFKTALRKAGIRDFRFHDLRHTFASHLVMAGVDITTVSRLLGHKSLKMTLRYAHLAPAHMAKAVDILDCTLTGQESQAKGTYCTKTIQSAGVR